MTNSSKKSSMKSSIFVGVATAIIVAISTAHATSDDVNGMEKCKVVKDGKGMIKAGKGACKSGDHSCAGENKTGEIDAWIMVPKGQCDKINHGDLSEVSEEVKAKLNM